MSEIFNVFCWKLNGVAFASTKFSSRLVGLTFDAILRRTRGFGNSQVCCNTCIACEFYFEGLQRGGGDGRQKEYLPKLGHTY